MRKKTIGIIGAGNHFAKKIFPVISNSNFYQIGGILRKVIGLLKIFQT